MNQEMEPQHIYLHPGEYIVATSPCRVSTLLGSCVSIVLWHPATKVGAMSHFILPTCSEKETSSHRGGRYGDEVLDLMLKDLAKLQIMPQQCQASVYGGGNMFPASTDQEQMAIGKKNGDMARRQLLSRSIPIVAESLFENAYRKIQFDVARGDVIVQQIQVAQNSTPCNLDTKSGRAPISFQCGDDMLLAKMR